jgi:hypothetical protein
LVAHEAPLKEHDMTKEELAKLRLRVAALFGAGHEDEEIACLWIREAAQLDHQRADLALSRYALLDGGPKRRFIAGKFMRIYGEIPERAEMSRTAIEERERIAARDAERAALAEEWRRARARCELLAPEQIEQISGLLARTRAPLSRDPSTWSLATVWVVTAILDGDPIPEVLRSAPPSGPQKLAEDRA